MTNEEAKQALFDRVPVIWNGIEYTRVTAIIYRLDLDGKLIVSAELEDKCGHSVTVARIKDIQGVSECNS